MPLRFLQPSSEPIYFDPQFSNQQIHVPIYPTNSHIIQGTSNPQVSLMAPITPYYRSVPPAPQSKGYFQTVPPASIEHFSHGHSTPSEDLNRAYQPLRRISEASIGQQVTPGYTRMYVPQSGQTPLHSLPGLRRRHSEYSSLVDTCNSGAMPSQSLPKDEVRKAFPISKQRTQIHNAMFFLNKRGECHIT